MSKTVEIKDQLKSIEEIMGVDYISPYVIQFGRHKGKNITDIPTAYVMWMSNGIQDPKMTKIASRELKRRGV